MRGRRADTGANVVATHDGAGARYKMSVRPTSLEGSIACTDRLSRHALPTAHAVRADERARSRVVHPRAADAGLHIFAAALLGGWRAHSHADPRTAAKHRSTWISIIDPAPIGAATLRLRSIALPASRLAHPTALCGWPRQTHERACRPAVPRTIGIAVLQRIIDALSRSRRTDARATALPSVGSDVLFAKERANVPRFQRSIGLTGDGRIHLAPDLTWLAQAEATCLRRAQMITRRGLRVDSVPAEVELLPVARHRVRDAGRGRVHHRRISLASELAASVSDRRSASATPIGVQGEVAEHVRASDRTQGARQPEHRP